MIGKRNQWIKHLWIADYVSWFELHAVIIYDLINMIYSVFIVRSRVKHTSKDVKPVQHFYSEIIRNC